MSTEAGAATVVAPFERLLAKEIEEHDEFNARIALIGRGQERLRRMRNTPTAPVRRMICEALIFWLWEPIIPRMVEIGREWGIEIDPDVMRPPADRSTANA